MAGQQWQRVKELFVAARERSGADRAAFLRAACGSDDALRSEVGSLLESADRAADFLEPAGPNDARSDALGSRSLNGESWIGPYRVLRIIGHGGMGVVYEVEQQNPRRRVALKVGRTGILPNDRRVRHFQREIEALARMDHPGIAAVFESGCTEQGEHYYAMELVHGVPLDRFVREARPATRDRLLLFLRICDAVKYAHQRGVIHRDLKPANILVLEEGNEERMRKDADANDSPPATAGRPGAARVKVLDFGLARLTDSDDGLTTQATNGGKIQGTLPYMSPEHARGDSRGVDVRSDVYSLGVILYEMLTGALPYNVTGTVLPEAIRIIREEPPCRPSVALPAIQGDLETIILKALEKDPDRRYQAVDALAEDIRRHLGNQPILARPASAAYQLRKFVARHKSASALTAAILVFVVALSVITSIQSARVARERDRAIAAQQKEADARESAEEVVEFLVGLFDRGDPSTEGSQEPKVRDLVDAAVERVETELAAQPLVQARLMTALGQVYTKLHDFERAETLLRTAMEMRGRPALADDSDLAESLIALAELRTTSGRFDEGYQLLGQAREIRLRRFGPSHASVTETTAQMGGNRFYARDWQAAERNFRESIEQRRGAAAADDAELLNDQANLGLVLVNLRRLDEAESLLRGVLEAQERVLGDHVKTALTLDHLAHLMFKKKNAAEAERLAVQRVEMLRRVTHDTHPQLLHALHNYAYLVGLNQGPERSVPIYQDLVTRLRSRFGEQHRDVADALHLLGAELVKLQRYDQAESALEDALRIRRKLFGDGSLQAAQSAHDLAALYLKMGRADPAEPLLLETYSNLEANHPADNRLLRSTAALLGQLYDQRGQTDQALIWRARLKSE